MSEINDGGQVIAIDSYDYNLEKIIGSVKAIEELLEQRDELLAALKAQDNLCKIGLLRAGSEEIARVDSLRKSAIAKCEGKS